jgi:hypothetical protein
MYHFSAPKLAHKTRKSIIIFFETKSVIIFSPGYKPALAVLLHYMFHLGALYALVHQPVLLHGLKF